MTNVNQVKDVLFIQEAAKKIVKMRKKQYKAAKSYKEGKKTYKNK